VLIRKIIGPQYCLQKKFKHSRASMTIFLSTLKIRDQLTARRGIDISSLISADIYPLISADIYLLISADMNEDNF